jgi:hypothetical protein
MKIYGAGIAGLLAGCHFQRATILEAGSEGQVQHKAVLRFRTPEVGDSVGIDFRKVTVHKGICVNRKSVAPSIKLANLYSKKVIGKLADRSIWNLQPSERYIAPEDFLAQLAERCAGRIQWNHTVTQDEVFGSDEPAISTLPMSLMHKWFNEHEGLLQPNEPEFKYAPIVVRRWRIPDADVFQTIYFPSPDTPLYRASITGDLLIAEYVDNGKQDRDDWDLFDAFGISPHDAVPIEKVSQRYGKIAKIDDNWRKNFMFELTHRHQIYSLGRFGTWRNILMDDVLHDIGVVKKLMNTTTYDRHRTLAK